MNRNSCWVTAIVFVFSSLIWWQGTDGLRAFTSETARRVDALENGRVLSDLSLEKQDGTVLSLSDYRGKLVLVDFIYTRCPDVCHALGFQFKQILTQIQESDLSDKVVLLSISFDPEHDTPAQLAAYLQRYTKDIDLWNGARSLDASGLEILLNELGVVVLENDKGGYDHNAAIHLIDQHGKLAGIYDFQASIQIISEVVRLSEEMVL